MASYRLVVERIEENPNFEDEVKGWNRAHGFGGGVPEFPNRERAVRVLTVELTDEEWARVKDGVVEVWR